MVSLSPLTSQGWAMPYRGAHAPGRLTPVGADIGATAL
jgi:hypothetical protein